MYTAGQQHWTTHCIESLVTDGITDKADYPNEATNNFFPYHSFLHANDHTQIYITSTLLPMMKWFTFKPILSHLWTESKFNENCI